MKSDKRQLNNSHLLKYNLVFYGQKSLNVILRYHNLTSWAKLYFIQLKISYLSSLNTVAMVISIVKSSDVCVTIETVHY